MLSKKIARLLGANYRSTLPLFANTRKRHPVDSEKAYGVEQKKAAS